MNATTQKLFFITGVSSGFGRFFAQAALDAGHRVVGTLRDETARGAFERLAPGRSFGRLLDVTFTDQVAGVVDGVEREIGPIDVAINNAGYGHEGLIEESPLEDFRRQFDVNVFGAVAVMQAVLPHMRQRRAGRILNITSMGGIVTFAGLGVYHGSKFALEGISEALGKEVKPLGIHVTAIAPGGFRTDWAGRSMVRAARSIGDYDSVFEPIRAARLQRNGKQSGDPEKAAQAMLKLVEHPNPPAHLLLGKDAVQGVRDKLATLSAEIGAWEDVSIATDFSPPVALSADAN